MQANLAALLKPGIKLSSLTVNRACQGLSQLVTWVSSALPTFRGKKLFAAWF